MAAGQSNSANDAEVRVTTAFPKQVINYFNGECYVSASPLLGATKEGGEFLTLMGDTLVRSNAYDTVVIVSAGFGGSSIFRWIDGADLNHHLQGVIQGAQARYSFTHFVWHQGEADFASYTNEVTYRWAFKSLLSSLRTGGMTAPAFISVATRCGNRPPWQPDNPTSRAQRSLVDNAEIFLGADTDLLLNPGDRQADGCHLSKTGQEKTAQAYAHAILAGR